MKTGTSVRRRNLSPDTRLKVWVRSGGRCVICNRYLLDGQLTGREATFGELAHIVGQTSSAGSPRGLATMDLPDRDDPDNLVLICDDEHDEMDKTATRDFFGVELIRELKRAHEERIRRVTAISPDQTTVVLRMIGRLNGSAVEVGQETAARTVITTARRFPKFNMAYDRSSIEIDLRNIPGELSGSQEYYRMATSLIDEIIEHKLTEGALKEQIRHLSVFAFARWPLIVYLGSRLDDTMPVDVYQRHRSSQMWEWPSDSPGMFAAFTPDADVTDTGDGVLILNISGTVQCARIPVDLQNAPRFRLDWANRSPSPDALSSRQALQDLEAALRELFAYIESSHGSIERLHTFAAIPMSAAVALGRVLNSKINPCLILYDRTLTGYESRLEVGQQ